MRWDDTFKGGHECYKWYDLLEGEGADDDKLLGYVRENIVAKNFIACINEGGMPNEQFDTLEDAKAHIVTYYVTKKLEGT